MVAIWFRLIAKNVSLHHKLIAKNNHNNTLQHISAWWSVSRPTQYTTIYVFPYIWSWPPKYNDVCQHCYVTIHITCRLLAMIVATIHTKTQLVQPTRLATATEFIHDWAKEHLEIYRLPPLPPTPPTPDDSMNGCSGSFDALVSLFPGRCMVSREPDALVAAGLESSRLQAWPGC